MKNTIKSIISQKSELQESINSLQAVQEETNKFSTTIKSLVS